MRDYTRQGHSQARLDRIYVSKEILIAKQYSIPESLSDHDIVVLQIKNIITPERGKGTWKNNIKVYESDLFQEELTTGWPKWQTLHPTLFQNKINWWLHTKGRIKDMNKKEILRTELHNLSKRLPDESNLLPQYHKIKKVLTEIQLSNTKQKLFKSKSIKTGNQALGSKEFFQQSAANRKNTTIEILSDQQGKIIAKKAELLEATQKFYQELYNELPTDPSAMHHFLHYIVHRPAANHDDNKLFQ